MPELHDLLKSHVDAYTRKDGTVVGAHETKASKHAARSLPTVVRRAIDAGTPVSQADWKHKDGVSEFDWAGRNGRDMIIEGIVGSDPGWSYHHDAGTGKETITHTDGHSVENDSEAGVVRIRHGKKK